MERQLGQRGENLIKSYEKLELAAYKPTPDDVWTIGWGHTAGVRQGDKCTVEEAEQFFQQDTANAVKWVNAIGTPLTQAMFDALVSIVFNVGAAAVAPNSTIGLSLRQKDYLRAWRGFALWTKQAGKDLLGLARRRAKEMVMFLEDGLP